ncbi:hypothetical protein BIY37_03035 [Candidatus Brocadia sapporoensis]|uniref:Uncharacterized protein n=1 Tax=Candidatus Brocadia sapporoensis TaxID=392547 RepID=A0A1V6M253_9BACT|nr:hypothetical protein BIY37_03035 [Candidatus Brocadia sapporoensis]TVL94768.1 MAG: hypothetical protein CV082_13605 [Candidatus Brocadia sp. BL1]
MHICSRRLQSLSSIEGTDIVIAPHKKVPGGDGIKIKHFTNLRSVYLYLSVKICVPIKFREG